MRKLLILVSLTLPVAPAAARPTLSATPATVAAGGDLQVAYRLARPAKAALRLDRKHLVGLKAKARGRLRVTLPRDVAPGRHVLALCVKRRCKARTRLTVTKPAPAPAAVDFTGPADPLHVDARTDTTRAKAETIGIAGGSISATSAAGEQFKLTIPAGALLSDERIVITPLESVDGLPFADQDITGVQLEPSGLRFAKPVRLEISGGSGATGFLYQHDGQEFQLYPTDGAGFELLHFSGVGLATATEAERNAQLLRDTTDVEGRLLQHLSALSRTPDPARVDALLLAYHDQVIEPLMAAARTDDNLAIQAVNKYFGWDRLVALLGSDEHALRAQRQARQEDMLTIVTNAAIRAHRRCVENNAPEELPMILSWWRHLSLLGIADQMPVDFWESIRGCARFELDFATSLRQERQGGGPEGPEVWNGRARADDLILEPDPVTLQQSGVAVADYLEFRIDVPPHEGGTGCWMGGGEWDSTFPLQVSRLEMDLNPIQRPDGSYGYPQLERGAIAVSIVAFSPAEQVFLADCNGQSDPWEDRWLGTTWYELHEDETDAIGNVVVDDWTVPAGAGSLLGVKTYARTKELSGWQTREATTIELRHAPQG